MENKYIGEFGTCCIDLQNAMDANKIPNSFFRHEDNNVFYLTIGFVDTEYGPGFFDQAVLYCPFCGQKLQDREEIKNKAL